MCGENWTLPTTILHHAFRRMDLKCSTVLVDINTFEMSAFYIKFKLRLNIKKLFCKIKKYEVIIYYN